MSTQARRRLSKPNALRRVFLHRAEEDAVDALAPCRGVVLRAVQREHCRMRRTAAGGVLNVREAGHGREAADDFKDILRQQLGLVERETVGQRGSEPAGRAPLKRHGKL